MLHVSTHASHSAGISLETSPLMFQEADVRMAAIARDVSLGDVETMTLTAKDRQDVAHLLRPAGVGLG